MDIKKQVIDQLLGFQKQAVRAKGNPLTMAGNYVQDKYFFDPATSKVLPSSLAYEENRDPMNAVIAMSGGTVAKGSLIKPINMEGAVKDPNFVSMRNDPTMRSSNISNQTIDDYMIGGINERVGAAPKIKQAAEGVLGKDKYNKILSKQGGSIMVIDALQKILSKLK